MDKTYRDAIQKEFVDCAKNTLLRVKNSMKKNDEGGNYKPFHESILIPQAILWSKFERSFSTSFGQRLVEEVSQILARASGASEVVRQKQTNIDIDKSQANEIDEHSQKIKEGKLKGLWSDDLKSISNVKKSNVSHKAKIISDLWFKRDNQEYFFSIKTVKPNIDQTIEAKRDLLKLKINNSKANVYYGLYYNPWGEQRDSYKHSPPMKVFNFYKDEVVLIGKEYWDIIGGEGAYEELLEIAERAGKETKKIVESFSSEI